jgi:histidyl-tRNA synthetase
MSAKKENNQTPESVRGMRDIFGTEYYERQGFFEKAQEIAMYYGFDPIDTPVLESEEVFIRGVGTGTDIVDKELYRLATRGGDKLVLRPEKTASIMRSYIEHGMKSWTQPVMFYYCGPMFRHDKPQKGRYRQFHQFGLEILGTEAPVADALIIQTAFTILQEVGAPKDIFVEINSIGDKDSRNEYEKALRAYYRKFANKLPAVDRERVKTSVLRVLDSKEAVTIEINKEAPASMDYLTPAAKRHFKTVLEYLDELGIPYQINKCLVRGLDYYSDTVFEIIETVTDPDTGSTRTHSILGGGRYNYLAKSMGHKKDVPAVGMAMGVERIVEASWWKHLTPRIIKPPKLYFIQLGFEAKLKSLAIIEELRKAKVPILQSLSKDKLSIQLATAEKLEVPHVLIFGQREALDSTVIVRDMLKRSQETVKITELVEYLKKLK